MGYVTAHSRTDYRPAPTFSADSPEREAEALKAYEQLFLFQMLKEMRKTVPDYGVMDGGSQKEYFQEMMDDFLAGEMAASGQLGVARQMAAQLHAAEVNSRVHGAPGEGIALQEPIVGIPRNASASGIELVDGRPPGIALPEPARGIAVDIQGRVGIPLNRAHENYRAGESHNHE